MKTGERRILCEAAFHLQGENRRPTTLANREFIQRAVPAEISKDDIKRGLATQTLSIRHVVKRQQVTIGGVFLGDPWCHAEAPVPAP